MMPVALTIAGSDPSGGAGIQADLKTFHQHRVYGTSAITLLTVQNTMGVRHVEMLDASLVADQIAAVVEDMPPRAIKTGALGTKAIVEAVARLVESSGAPVVVDPVMISKHGEHLVNRDAAKALRDVLVPRATLVTPNAYEASFMCGFEVRTLTQAADAARALATLGPAAVLIKGGHLDELDAIDLLYYEGEIHELGAPRIASPHTHGTGCTYSAAIASRLALGASLVEAVAGAKAWLTEALRTPPCVGQGIGPVGHFARLSTDRPPP